MNGENVSYKLIHERYMENLNGTTIWENLSVVAPSPLLIFILTFIKCLFCTKLIEKSHVFLLEYSFIALPSILLCTVLSNFTWHVTKACILVYGLIMIVVLKGKKKLFNKIMSSPFQQAKRPHITYFRSAISLYTVICILAVDFKIFPRRFAKTEAFGYGLMDTGVGFYVMSNGIVVNYKNKRNIILRSLISSFPIIFLGMIRAISVEFLQYQKHVSEYGIHWNFFFTLAVVKFIGSLLTVAWPRRTALVAISLGLGHQLALTCGFQDWILSDSPRNDFISANREGILSLPGYISLYLASISMGAALRSKCNTMSDAMLHSFRLLVASVVATGLTLLSESYFGISRRLVNLTYIFWITSLCLLAIFGYLIMEISLRIVCLCRKMPTKNLMTPTLLDAINSNGLLFFLFSNVLTGLVNLSVKTLFVPPVQSLIIICGYIFTTCFVMNVMYFNSIKLKFW